jgi:hypothetical protein
MNSIKKGFIKLKIEKVSNKFGYLFPKDTFLVCNFDNDNRLFVSHPMDNRIKMLVEEKETYNFIEKKD